MTMHHIMDRVTKWSGRKRWGQDGEWGEWFPIRHAVRHPDGTLVFDCWYQNQHYTVRIQRHGSGIFTEIKNLTEGTVTISIDGDDSSIKGKGKWIDRYHYEYDVEIELDRDDGW
jgi:hypothetical protein